jgi:hypothetical protein
MTTRSVRAVIAGALASAALAAGCGRIDYAARGGVLGSDGPGLDGSIADGAPVAGSLDASLDGAVAEGSDDGALGDAPLADGALAPPGDGAISGADSAISGECVEARVLVLGELSALALSSSDSELAVVGVFAAPGNGFVISRRTPDGSTGSTSDQVSIDEIGDVDIAHGPSFTDVTYVFRDRTMSRAYLRRLDAAFGSAIDLDVRIDVADDARAPAVAYSAGVQAATWTADPGTGSQVRLRILDPAVAVLPAPGTAPIVVASPGLDADIAAAGTGFLVVYRRPGVTDDRVVISPRAADGTASGAVIELTGDGAHSRPVLIEHGAELVALWSATTPIAGVFARRIAVSGAPLAAARQLSTSASRIAATSGGGRLVVAWAEGSSVVVADLGADLETLRSQTHPVEGMPVTFDVALIGDRTAVALASTVPPPSLLMCP